MKHIFLISGLARHGKNTVANILSDKLDGKSINIAMADYLKIILKKYYNWDGKKDECGRQLLQYIGTDKIREELGWDTFHVERVCQDIKIIKNDYDYIFIPDARFKNEILYTKAKFPYNTTTIRVERPNFKSALTEEQKKHRSEVDLNDFKHDYYIVNNGNLEDLTHEICGKMEKLIDDLNRKKFFSHYA